MSTDPTKQTTDLLARLRSPDIALWDEETVIVSLCREAADEIERLRKIEIAARVQWEAFGAYPGLVEVLK